MILALINAARILANSRIKKSKQRSILRNKTFQSATAIILPGPLK